MLPKIAKMPTLGMHNRETTRRSFVLAVTYEIPRNSACIKISGQLRRSDWITVQQMVADASRKLAPGWTVALDLRGLDLIEFGDLASHGSMLRTVFDCGAARVVALFDEALTAMQDRRMALENCTDEITSRHFDEHDWRAATGYGGAPHAARICPDNLRLSASDHEFGRVWASENRA